MSKTIVFILDETGSMQTQREQTITKFNQYVEDVAKTAKRWNPVNLDLVLFNSTKFEVRENGTPIKKVAKLTYETYKPQANTPLYDAIGKAVEQAEGPALVVILTDGQENSSKEYSLSAIKSLISQKEKEGWTFVFLASNLDVMSQAFKFGLSSNSVADYGGNTRTAMAAASTISSDYAKGIKLQSTQSYVEKAKKEGS